MPVQDFGSRKTDETIKRLADITFDSLAARLPANILGEAGERIEDIIEFFLKAAKGEVDFDVLFKEILGDEPLTGASGGIVDFVSGIVTSEEFKQIAETLGGVVYNPVTNLFDEYGDESVTEIDEFPSAFVGLMVSLGLPMMLAHTLRGSAVGTVVGGIGNAINQMYWYLGLGFLGWMTISPQLQSGLLPRLERHWKVKYRPERFKPLDLVYLFYAGDITLSELHKGFAEAGYRTEDIPLVVENSYRSLSRSDIKELYDAGALSDKDVKKELLRQGYNPLHVSVIIDSILHDGSSVDKNPTASDVKKAYKNNLIGRVEFVEWLRTLGYSGEAISLQLALIDLDRQSKQRELALAQVKAAYTVGRLRRVETTAYLQTLNYAVEDIGIILDTWDAEKAPKVLKLNAGSITKYLRSGALNRTQAEGKLLDLGYTPGDVQIIIQDTLLKANVGSKPITVSYLMQARSIGALTDSELTTRLKALGVPQNDISIYIQLASHKELGALTVNDIERAYKTDIISAQAAIEQQLSIGADRTLAEQRLRTWEAEHERTRYRLTPATLSLALKQKQISDTQAYGYLRDLGLSDSDAKLIVQVATSITPRSFNQTEVKELYLNYVVDRAKAVTLLEQTGLSRDNAALSIQAWDSLIAKEIPTPSIQQLLSANRDGVLSDTEFESKLRDMRLSTDTIQFYLRLSEQETVEATKELTKADIVGMYADEILPYYDALERLIDNGYTPDDAMLLLKRKEKRLEDSLLHSLLINGSISGENFIYEAENAGYTLDEIAAYFDRLGV